MEFVLVVPVFGIWDSFVLLQHHQCVQLPKVRMENRTGRIQLRSECLKNVYNMVSHPTKWVKAKLETEQKVLEIGKIRAKQRQ